MDFQEIFSLLFGLATTCLGFFVQLQTSIDAKLSQIYELLAGGRH